MKIKSYGLLFDFLPTKEIENEEMPVVKNYVRQDCTNFVLVNYFKSERKNLATNAEGFQNLVKQMYIEMYMIDTNPRKMLYDKKDDSFYRILETPISQEFEPSKRKLYILPIEFINDSDLRFDDKFIKDKFNELWSVLNGSI